MAEVTILFLHGASLGGWMWDEVIQLLTEFNCLAPNLPEHGSDKTEFSLASSVNSVNQLIQEQNTPVHMVGISLGALVGLELLRQHPENIQTAMLSSISMGALPAGAILTALSSPIAWLSTRNFAIQQTAKQLGVPETMYPQFATDLKQMSGALFKRVNQSIHHYHPEEQTYPLDKPILVVCGENEPKFVKQNQLRLIPKLGLNAVYQVSNAGHAWCFENPKLFADTVRAWITQDTLPASLQPL